MRDFLRTCEAVCAVLDDIAEGVADGRVALPEREQAGINILRMQCDEIPSVADAFTEKMMQRFDEKFVLFGEYGLE